MTDINTGPVARSLNGQTEEELEDTLDVAQGRIICSIEMVRVLRTLLRNAEDEVKNAQFNRRLIEIYLASFREEKRLKEESRKRKRADGDDRGDSEPYTSVENGSPGEVADAPIVIE